MTRKAVGWGLALALGLLAGLALLLAPGILGAGGTVTLTIDGRGCAGGSTLHGEEPEQGVHVVDLAVRSGEPFHVPVPEGWNGTRYELRGEGVNLTRADADGTPILTGPRGASPIFGSCAAWTPGDAPGRIGPFVADADGTVRAHLWPR